MQCTKNIYPLLIISFLIIGLGCTNNGTHQHNKKHQDSILLSQGEKLFVVNCQSCHAVTKTDFILPNSFLYNDDLYWYKYLTSQDSLLQNNDCFTVVLKRQWGNTNFKHHFQITKDEYQALKAYIISK